MNTSRRIFAAYFGMALLLVILSACAAATPMTAPSQASPPTMAPAPTKAPAPSAPTAAPASLPTTGPNLTQPPTALPTSIVEERLAELEWPPRLRLGESDVVRLSLIPSQEGYTLTTEFPEHQAQSQSVHIPRPGGYDLYAIARLDGVGFDVAPQGDQIQYLPIGEAISWRWSLSPNQPGQQRLSVALRLRWMPSDGAAAPVREVNAFSKSLDVRVASFFGLSHAQAMTAGMIGLILGGGLCVIALVSHTRPDRSGKSGSTLPQRLRSKPEIPIQAPNPDLVIEPPPNLSLSSYERNLLQALFNRYARLVIKQEFLSGYSGARTLLVLPVRADGRADAYTIAKLGGQEAIRREYDNYEAFVKDTLPPVTARLQHPPVSTGNQKGALAALQYTFIGAPGTTPTSLRQALQSQPDPGWLLKLFDTFGPNWWMQRRPYSFRLAQEYDRLLPTHLVVEPAGGKGSPLSGHTPPARVSAELGDSVILQDLSVAEQRSDGKSLSLVGSTAPGQPPLRIRWLSLENPQHACGRVVATRLTLLRSFISGFDLLGLPDPFPPLPGLLEETVSGSQSIIHGDLNVENVLIGPGGLVWLIDFAQTREGHPLYDFAHLQAEIIAHVIAPRLTSPVEYLALLDNPSDPASPLGSLLTTMQSIAGRCLFNPSQPGEYQLALYMACLGALKYTNLPPFSRYLLYLTSAHLIQSL
jgi:hypothetical protein